MSTARAEVFPVGEILADELEAHGWTQAEFAEILGRPAQFVSEIISNKKEITRESATQIAAALGTSPEMWLSMQDRYYLWRRAQDQRAQEQLSDVRLRARLKELAPIAVLTQRDLIKGATASEQESELKSLYGLHDIYDEPELSLAARRSRDNEGLTSTQLAWVACVRRRAESMQVQAFDSTAFEELARHLTQMIRSPEDIVSLVERFAGVGVRLVYLEAFPGSKMDGCSFLLSEGSPVIGISGRGKRLDKVLFTLLHEAAHIHLGHLAENSIVVDDKDDQHTLGREAPTDELAGTWALPRKLPPLPQRMNQSWITAVSQQQGVHPIVLIGRLQYQRLLPWKTTLVRNAPSVVEQMSKW